jgi:hypothetical protein
MFAVVILKEFFPLIILIILSVYNHCSPRFHILIMLKQNCELVQYFFYENHVLQTIQYTYFMSLYFETSNINAGRWQLGKS